MTCPLCTKWQNSPASPFPTGDRPPVITDNKCNFIDSLEQNQQNAIQKKKTKNLQNDGSVFVVWMQVWESNI